METRNRENLFAREMLPLWLGLVLVAVVPLLSIWRVGPLSSFFLESGSLLCCLAFVLLALFSGSLKTKIPPASYYFAALAVFWAAQARLMALPYVGVSDMAAWSFAVLALLCWACRGWTAAVGTERALSALAGALVAGCVFQAAIGWLQYTGAAAAFKGLLMFRSGIVEGQFGQRNHFAHYLMWGVLSAGWLWSQRRLHWAAALALAAFFAATMGLTGSRTVFGYVLAMAVLLPAYRLFSGCLSSRAAWGLGVAAALVLAGQFAVEPVLQMFQDSSAITSAAERISHGAQLEGSGRGYEWRKAWQIFLSAPWFGYGWGSYPLQGFLTDVYPTGFRPYENGVLFTHSHNSFLNLLAEMGIVGTTLVLGGLTWAVRGCFQRANAPYGLFLLALMAVSLVHSALEYPLWYVYFLSVFALFAGFSPSASARESKTVSGSLKIRYAAVAAVALLTAGGIVRLGFAYQHLRSVSGSAGSDPVKRADNIIGLLTIAKTEPMLRYYAQLQLVNYIDPESSHMPDWAEQTAREALRFRPYANAQRYAFAAYRAGHTAEAREWMKQMYRYYPAKMPAYARPIMNTDYYPELRGDYTAACRAYYKSIGETPVCAEALPALKDVLKSIGHLPASAVASGSLKR